ncbi:MAG: DNA polymerase III subunit delta [Solirubrobacteraceae bacterium]
MPSLKPVYLVHGEDHGAVAERRASLRALGERHGGASAVEVLAGEAASPRGVALALSTFTFALGGAEAGGVGRVIIVDGVERWKQVEVQRDLAPAFSPMPPGTTVALFAREDGRAKAPGAVHELVKAAGGQIVAHGNVKPWELPRWVRGEASRLGLALDAPAAKALVDQVGERQQRLLRELEKLALELAERRVGDVQREAGAKRGADAKRGGGETPSGQGKPIRVDSEWIEARATASAERKAYTLADALLAGERERALRIYLELSARGESLSGLLYLIAARLRDALAVVERLRAGEGGGAVARSLRMPPKAAQRFVASLEHADEHALERALGRLADLELDLRGGERLAPQRRPDAALSEQTLALATIAAMTA